MRYLMPYLQKDLKKKMVFLGGPRQVGKTTIAKEILKESSSGLYLNWDRLLDQKSILNEGWSDSDQLLIFDEIHKHPKWKNIVKGYYDTQKELHQFLITGSARLDVYRRGGDSLLGRYHHWRLHPFSLDEKLSVKLSSKETVSRLMRVGGFPEVFLDNDEREARRWREERYDKILRDDIRDIEVVRQIQQMGILLQLLRERVGGEIVLSHLAQDVGVSVPTITKWIEIFERMYLVFTVRSYTKKVARAVLKPFKVYFFDNGDVVGDEGAVFENLVANHLLKRLHFNQDYTGKKWELQFIRDKEQREIDFAIVCDGKLIELIEVKLSEQSFSPSLVRFAEKLLPERAVQIVLKDQASFKKGRLLQQNLIEYFSIPPW